MNQTVRKRELCPRPQIGALVHAQLAIAVFVCAWRMFEPLERRLAGQRRTASSACLKLARQQAENGIVAQLIVIVQVLVAKGYAMDTLRNKRFNLMLDPLLSAAILEAGSHLPGEGRGSWSGAVTASLGRSMLHRGADQHLFWDLQTGKVSLTSSRRGGPKGFLRVRDDKTSPLSISNTSRRGSLLRI